MLVALVEDSSRAEGRGFQPQGQSGRASSQEGTVLQRSQCSELRNGPEALDQLAASELSESSCLSKPPDSEGGVLSSEQLFLKKGETKRLKRCRDELLSQTVRDLVPKEQLILLEVACSETSVLSTTMQDLTQDPHSAKRLSIGMVLI